MGQRQSVAVEKRFLHFPVKTGAKGHRVTVEVDGERVRWFDIELADAGTVEWWAPLDVGEWAGKTLEIAAESLPEESTAFDALRQSDTLIGSETLYQEPLRPQIHFAPKRGWTNDPNGLVYFRGEYHLFFQHNPYGWNWGNMHWGHATSTDLVHWQEHGEALYPDAFGTMFSGSAVVDGENTSGFGSEDRPPLVLIYTAAGDPTTQCIAYSLDGRTFTKYAGNPVVPQITGGNRDPKVCWHAPSGQWLMVLYVTLPDNQHTVHFFTSPNLREWTLASVTTNPNKDAFLYECPDFFELPIDGDPDQKKWVLNAANSEYALGTFDGTTFTPETGKLPDVRGKGFYAAQTFSDVPDGRRIQIGWCQAPSPGMPFNQAMSLPCELTLRTTPDGPRLHRTPVQELETLRDGGNQAENLADFRAECIELRAEFTPGDTDLTFTLRGATIVYETATQEIVVNGHRAPAPLIDGKQTLIAYIDRTLLEVLTGDGLIYIPLPFIPDPENQTVAVEMGEATLHALEVYTLHSIWR